MPVGLTVHQTPAGLKTTTITKTEESRIEDFTILHQNKECRSPGDKKRPVKTFEELLGRNDGKRKGHVLYSPSFQIESYEAFIFWQNPKQRNVSTWYKLEQFRKTESQLRKYPHQTGLWTAKPRRHFLGWWEMWDNLTHCVTCPSWVL